MSKYEDLFALQAEAAGLTFERQVRLIPIQRTKPLHKNKALKTRHKVDFLFRSAGIVLEVQGGTWSGGRHTRGKGYEGDCLKQALLQLEGFTVYYCTGSQVESGQALSWVREAIDNDKKSKTPCCCSGRSKEDVEVARQVRQKASQGCHKGGVDTGTTTCQGARPD